MSFRPTVFVVDDNASIRDSLRWLLGTIGVDVRTFPSANEFLSVYDASQPGCLVLDVRMPELSGFDLQRLLAARGSCMPVIVVTGHPDATAKRALTAGACSYLEKPFAPEKLLECVRRGLDLDARRRGARG